jgi:hypothetical protein
MYSKYIIYIYICTRARTDLCAEAQRILLVEARVVTRLLKILQQRVVQIHLQPSACAHGGAMGVLVCVCVCVCAVYMYVCMHVCASVCVCVCVSVC